MILCTAGYKNFSFYQFWDLVKKMNALVIDVRYVPYTLLPFWSQNVLQEKLGEKYVHIKEFGNVNYKNHDFIKVCDFPTGINRFKEVSEEYKVCILLCGCEDFNTCHRKIIAEKIADEIEVERIDHL